MVMKNFLLFAGILFSTMLFTGCFHDEDELGACVSDFTDLNIQYCYSDFDESECTAQNTQQVNGVNWFFHGGQSCADCGLVEGSN